MTDHLDEKQKTILTGRIYPAIRACVSNRYKILLSLFAYYSFVLNAKAIPIFESQTSRTRVNVLVSVVFTLFIFQNSLNYLLNAKEQMTYEGGKTDCCTLLWNFARVEGLFFVVSVVVVWAAYYFIGSK